jgi:hypothetical protein
MSTPALFQLEYEGRRESMGSKLCDNEFGISPFFLNKTPHRALPFTTNYIELNTSITRRQTNPQFLETMRVQIPRSGHAIGPMWLELEVSIDHFVQPETRDAYLSKHVPSDYYAYRCINYIDCIFNNEELLTRHYGEYMVIHQQLAMKSDDIDCLRIMCSQHQGYVPKYTRFPNDITVYAPLFFWFCARDPDSVAHAFPILLSEKGGQLEFVIQFNEFDPLFTNEIQVPICVRACRVMSTTYTLGDPTALCRFLSSKKQTIETVQRFDLTIQPLTKLVDVPLPFQTGQCARLVWILNLAPVVLDAWQNGDAMNEDPGIELLRTNGQSYAGGCSSHGSNQLFDAECFDSTTDKCVFPSRPAHFFSHLQRLWYGNGIHESYTSSLKLEEYSLSGFYPSTQRIATARDAIYMYSFSNAKLSAHSSSLQIRRSNLRTSRDFAMPIEYVSGFLNLDAISKLVLRLQFKGPEGLPALTFLQVYAIIYKTIEINAATGASRVQ